MTALAPTPPHIYLQPVRPNDPAITVSRIPVGHEAAILFVVRQGGCTFEFCVSRELADEMNVANSRQMMAHEDEAEARLYAARVSA